MSARAVPWWERSLRDLDFSQVIDTTSDDLHGWMICALCEADMQWVRVVNMGDDGMLVGTRDDAFMFKLTDERGLEAVVWQAWSMMRRTCKRRPFRCTVLGESLTETQAATLNQLLATLRTHK
jgi:hypothetical protein